MRPRPIKIKKINFQFKKIDPLLSWIVLLTVKSTGYAVYITFKQNTTLTRSLAYACICSFVILTCLSFYWHKC